jgi:Glycosyl transferase family 2
MSMTSRPPGRGADQPEAAPGALSHTATGVTAIVPALNEEETIGAVVAGLRSCALVGDVVVVDGGSGDATAQRARAAGARVVVEPRRGYGRACLTGAGHARGADLLLFVDGDGSADTSQSARLLEPLLEGSADLVIGSRLQGHRARGAMLLHQRLGNVLVAAILRWRHGVGVTDVGPFRAVRAGVLSELGMSEMTYGWPTEMIVLAAARGHRVTEVAVDHHPRAGGHSKVSGDLRASIHAGVQMLRVALRGGTRRMTTRGAV